MSEENFNKPSLSYPTEIGSLAFPKKEIVSEKDFLYNASVEAAKEEFSRLKELADLINKQAKSLQEQLELSKLVTKAQYNFKPSPNHTYWLVKDKNSENLLLCLLGPDDWSTQAPDNYIYIHKMKYLPSGLWQKTA